MKFIKQFRKKGEGDLKVAYNEDTSYASPVLIGRISCEKKSLGKLFGHIPESFIVEIEEGIITDLW